MRASITTAARIARRGVTRVSDRWKGRVTATQPDRCPIPWKPSVFAPVFYGYRDLTVSLSPVATRSFHAAGSGTAGGPPLGPERVHDGHAVRIWYPTLDGSPQHAEILKGCGRYPLVILAHGSCPQDDEPHKSWFELPAVLARAGYLVLVPKLDLGAPSGNDAGRELIGRLAGWARSDWEHADAVMPAPATALVGHSWGAGLMGHVAQSAPGSYSAFVSLSGVEVPGGVLRSSLPKLVTWGGDLGLEVLGVPVSQWDRLGSPAHVAEFLGAGHWDYLTAGASSCDQDPGRGDCTLTPFLAADIVACFLTRYLRPEGVPHFRFGPVDLFEIARSLRPPAFYPLYLTTEQKFYAGGHLMAWQAVTSRPECGVDLRWVIGSDVGELTHR